jgi:Glycosyl transferase family 2
LHGPLVRSSARPLVRYFHGCISLASPPLISVLICSYNYERFVGQTIDSALAQTWPHTEVIVVDDGSSDGSWSVIQSFGDKVTAHRQTNGGQGAAYNQCFALSRGDWVIFLDCDDTLDADCLQRCVAQITDHINKVAFSLRVVDDQGRCTGNIIPYTLHEGDVRPTLQRFGHYGGPPGSGNLYRRRAIERCFPLDPVQWAMCADTVPFVVSAATGRVAAVPEPVGAYRIHRKANLSLGLFGNVLGSLLETLVLDDRRRNAAMALVADTLGYDPSVALLPTPTQVRTRVISWRIARAEHPYADDTAPALVRLAWRSSSLWPGLGWFERFTLMVWVLAVLVAPSGLLARLVRLNASNDAKRKLRRWAAVAQIR